MASIWYMGEYVAHGKYFVNFDYRACDEYWGYMVNNGTYGEYV